MIIDAVITSLEMQLEAPTSPFGHYIAFRFIDIYPTFPKVNDMINEVKQREDVTLVNYDVTYTGIHEDTDLSELEFTKH